MEMSWKERVFHSVSFEIGAVCLASLAVVLTGAAETGTAETGTAATVGVLIALIAMVWNFVFNYGFDKIFTAPRETRSLKLRVFHTLTFEIGFLFAGIPILAHFLRLTLWQAFLADIGLTVLITLYALLFNWAFDLLRAKRLALRAA